MERAHRLSRTLAPLGAIGLVLAAMALVADLPAGATARSSSVDRASLPLGDGRVTYSGPRRGYVYACRGSGGPGGGAQVEGPWIKGDGTFDLTAKPTVDGSVKWGNAWRKVRVTKSRRLLSGNGLPVGHTTGEYPVRAGDDAYQYDRNPNSIRSQTVRSALPRRAKRARRASCLPMGPIGVARNGVAIFNALDARQRDAVAHEVQDHCQGHPERSGTYHYHDVPDCLTKRESTRRASRLVGYALDGFPIYGPRGNGGRLLTNSDLDACHGKVSKVYFEGRWRRMYHYVATYEYPYTLGCFSGTPVSGSRSG